MKFTKLVKAAKAEEIEEFKQEVFIPESEKQVKALLERLYKFNLLNNEWIAYYKKNGEEFEEQLEDCKDVKVKLLDLIKSLEYAINK